MIIGSIDSEFTVAPKTDADHDLIEQAKSDPDAFGELYERYYNRILNYIYRRMPDVKIAEELTSNTFYNVLRALPKYRQKRSFHAWIYRIATNEVKMYLRSTKNRSIREKDFYTEKDIDRIYFISPGIETKEEKKEKELDSGIKMYHYKFTRSDGTTFGFGSVTPLEPEK